MSMSMNSEVAAPKRRGGRGLKDIESRRTNAPAPIRSSKSASAGLRRDEAQSNFASAPIAAKAARTAIAGMKSIKALPSDPSTESPRRRRKATSSWPKPTSSVSPSPIAAIGSAGGHNNVVPNDRNASAPVPEIPATSGSADHNGLEIHNGFVRATVSKRRWRVSPEIIEPIIALHRERRALQKQRTVITLQIKSEERWAAARRCRASGIDIKGKFPEVTSEDRAFVQTSRPRFFLAHADADRRVKECEKELLAYTKLLPVFAWAESQKGFGALSLAAIVGESGDLFHYSNPAKLWKRLGVAVIGGRSQRRVKDAAEAAEQGYNPRRRSEMHVIGECLMKAGGEYAALYKERKAYEIDKSEAVGLTVLPAARIAGKKNKDEYISDGHIHRRALRYVEKRLLRELWSAWRAAGEST